MVIRKKFISKLWYVPESYILDETITNNIAFGEEKKVDHNLVEEVIKISRLEKLINIYLKV